MTAVQAVTPSRKNVIHLYLEGHHPVNHIRAAMCGSVIVDPSGGRELVPIEQALSWTVRGPAGSLPLTWCRHCLGQAVDVTGLTFNVLIDLACIATPSYMYDRGALATAVLAERSRAR